MVADTDLSVLGYLSDYIYCLYGLRSTYAVVGLPLSVREGINVFLNNFVRIENSEESLAFKVYFQEIEPFF